MSAQISNHILNIAEAISIKYNNLVYELKESGQDVIVLSLGEAFFDIPLYSFADLPSPEIFHYGHSRGLFPLREQLADYYNSEYGVSVDSANEIMVTAGSKIALFMVFASIISPGDEVLICEPAWVSYTEQIKLCYGIPVGIPSGKPIKEFEQYITHKTRAIVINNPNNPCGKCYSREDFYALISLAQKYNIFLISDEAYSDFCCYGEFVSAGIFDPEKDNVIICNSMSKNYGMSGWRLGYVIARKKFIDEILKVNQHLITCPANILQLYVSRYFHRILDITKPQIDLLLQQRKKLSDYINDIGLKRLPGGATLYFFISTASSKLGSEKFCEILINEYQVSAVPGIGYGESCDGFIRVSMGSESVERIKIGLDRIKELIQITS
jgi:aspartate aminotransferase/aminotransferase